MSTNRPLYGCLLTLFAFGIHILGAQEMPIEEEFCCEEMICCEESPLCLIPYKGKVSFRYNDHSGNNRFDEFFFDGKITREALYCGEPHYKWNAELEVEWKKKGSDDVFIDKGFFKAKYEHRFDPLWVWRAEHETRWGKKDNLHYRMTNGLGLGYYLVETCDFFLQPKVMVRHVDANYRKNVAEFDEHGFWPSLGWELGWVLPYDLELEWEGYYGVNVEYAARRRFYSDIELTVPCGRGWAITLEHEIIYRSRVSKPGLRHYDSDFKFKIGYCF
jgi:hypothetical protein